MRYFFIIFFLASQILLAHEKIQYLLKNEPIDVIIPCTDKDLSTLELCIEGIKKNGYGIRRVIVVSSQPLTSSAEWFDEQNYPFNKLDVAFEIFGNFSDAEAFCSTSNSRIGWIYQQLLKLYAPFVIPDISSNVLVLDADTIFLNPVSFLGSNSEGLYNYGFEYHKPYFEYISRLLPGLTKVFPSLSGISHHMLFQKKVLEDLFYAIQSQFNMDAWKALGRCIDHKYLYGSSLSEYEIYFNFVFTRSDQIG
jgi:hypothetical protein